jgi:hypothetical protein
VQLPQPTRPRLLSHLQVQLQHQLLLLQLALALRQEPQLVLQQPHW